MIGEKSIPDEATRLINQAKHNNLQHYVPNTTVRAETSLQYYINESQPTGNAFDSRVVKERPKSIFLIFVFYGVVGLLFIHYFLTNNIQDDSEYSDSRLRTPSEDMRGQNGGVAAEHEACSNIGRNMLIKGGSAVDAAIASALCVGVVNSFSSGIGGGGFMMIRDAKGEIEFIDFRESAPRATNPEVYTKSPISAQVGGLSVGVPGELRGFETAHERHGKLAWKELFEPSILLAREGFPVGAELARYIKEEKDAILASSAMSKVYTKNGTLAKEGEWIFHKNLANTLEKVANFGSKAFYEGEVASSIINTLRKEGSVMELEDLASYKAIIRTPLTGTFKGHRVIASPLPTSGASLIAVLNIIEGFSNTNNTSQNYHRLTEALKYGFALRTELADPAFTDLTARVEQMISKSYANELRSNISESRTYDYQHYNPKFENKELPGTTHVSAIAADSSAAAITTTVNLIFGSKIMDPITGILFNDEMDDFSIPHVKNNYELFPSPANFIAPLKRPLSSTVPTIIELANDEGLLVVGGSGGSRILSAVTQLILNLVDNGLELAASLDFPRLHHQLLPNSIFLEPDFDPLIAKLLESKGHQITWWPKYKSAIQAVARSSDGSISAVSDSRKKGKAAAY